MHRSPPRRGTSAFHPGQLRRGARGADAQRRQPPGVPSVSRKNGLQTRTHPGGVIRCNSHTSEEERGLTVTLLSHECRQSLLRGRRGCWEPPWPGPAPVSHAAPPWSPHECQVGGAQLNPRTAQAARQALWCRAMPAWGVTLQVGSSQREATCPSQALWARVPHVTGQEVWLPGGRLVMHHSKFQEKGVGLRVGLGGWPVPSGCKAFIWESIWGPIQGRGQVTRPPTAQILAAPSTAPAGLGRRPSRTQFPSPWDLHGANRRFLPL